ncbi:ThiF family adenylyltransferase [Aromatoleum toluclasticum]|uniref:ThiF family adenylyltransferase n=1 Tax=Aromatoleum toluclasticum TaxID=92003 RepID=UPI00036225A8|nr:ThiF family adenylyltransferase [Aromatoleum toluclasticum]
MENEFLELPGFSSVAAESLTSRRSHSLLVAIERNKDFALVEVLRNGDEVALWQDALVVDVECHGVPSRNRHGIRFRERLAILLSADGDGLPDIRALRADFPRLMHENVVPDGDPTSLCLYFEPKRAVLRTWTAENFLRRIQWWLESSASDALHAADQPVEQPFFASPYELVLPWNFEQLREDPSCRFIVTRADARADGKFTSFLHGVSTQHVEANEAIAYFELTLPPVTHGFRDHHPPTLGELADVLTERGFGLLDALRKTLDKRITSDGVAITDDDKLAVILLRIPVCREEEALPESVQIKAFAVLVGGLQLGWDTGAYMEHAGKAYRNVSILQAADDTEAWRRHPIFAMEVHQFNTRAAARRQSGIEDEGPAGTLIGVGSLGSSMLDMWARSGWGAWTVVDNDHVKPHNLSRHSAFAGHVGRPKVVAARELFDAATNGAGTLEVLEVDACTTSCDKLEAALRDQELVVDCSTTLDYPRLASRRDGLARHVSVFITPSGNDAVLMAEDGARTIRLGTLEAQYYRAAINNPWGETHLVGHAGTFWSGAGCRDISLVMPYWRVLSHASTLAEHVRNVTQTQGAAIRIWRHEPESGATSAFRLEPEPEIRLSFGELDLFLDEGLRKKLYSMRSAAFPNETGGVLLGYYDLNVGMVVLVDALPAPPDSRGSPQGFERGVAGVKEAVVQARERTGMVVGYVGEWHSHPPGSRAKPSSDDLVQLGYLASGMAEEGLPAVQLIAGEQEIAVLRGDLAR